MKYAIRNVHFIGIGGIGMSGIAEVLHRQGYCISGSDKHESEKVKHLRALGITIFIGHEALQVTKADVVVYSSAIQPDNPEYVAAKQRGITLIPRALMLGELLRFQKGIAIAGTHGKTTTSSLIAHLLECAELHPSFVIGGTLLNQGVSAKVGTGEYIVVEADESDASFLHLSPIMSVITNIDSDHMDTYDQDILKLQNAFIEFAHCLPFYGHVIACADDAGVCAVLPAIRKSVITYGLSEGAMLCATTLSTEATGMAFDVDRSRLGLTNLSLQLSLFGNHNVSNALAAVAVASLLEIPDTVVAQAFKSFQGAKRRLQSYGEHVVAGKQLHVIEDYAHHPTEIKATLQAVQQAFPNRRIVVVFQPHRFTRTRDLFDDFVHVLNACDYLVLTEVYPAGEQPIVRATSHDLAQGIRQMGRVQPIIVKDMEDLPQVIEHIAIDRDVVLFMGAGSIDQTAGDLVRLWQPLGVRA